MSKLFLFNLNRLMNCLLSQVSQRDPQSFRSRILFGSLPSTRTAHFFLPKTIRLMIHIPIANATSGGRNSAMGSGLAKTDSIPSIPRNEGHSKLHGPPGNSNNTRRVQPFQSIRRNQPFQSIGRNRSLAFFVKAAPRTSSSANSSHPFHPPTTLLPSPLTNLHRLRSSFFVPHPHLPSFLPSPDGQEDLCFV